MDFAPYQESPEATRALSPSPRNSTSSPRPSMSPTRRSFSPGVRSPAFLQSASNNIAKNGGAQGQAQAHGIVNPWAQSQDRNGYFPDLERGVDGAGRGGGGGGGREGLHEFETSLPLRLDYEACLAYLLLPPVGGVLLLILERKSDYVRFHAWQSALLFSPMFVVHLVFSWSVMTSWLLFIVDAGLIVWLTRRAYLDADTLDRCEVPFFGRLANSILDDE